MGLLTDIPHLKEGALREILVKGGRDRPGFGEPDQNRRDANNHGTDNQQG